MHHWGDGFPYFADVENAAYEIGEFCSKWGRIGVTQTKEKYGTARVYCHFGIWNFHALLVPRRIFWQGHTIDWLWKLDCKIGTKILSLFQRPIIAYQSFIYRLAYKKAIQKYPHIKEEILNCADFDEFLEGL